MVSAIASVGEPAAYSPRPGALGAAHFQFSRVITRGKRTFDADEQTPLRLGELAEYFRCSRWAIYRDINRGYELEFGTTTTPVHYRAWLRAHPVLTKLKIEKMEKAEKLARELAKMK